MVGTFGYLSDLSAEDDGSLEHPGMHKFFRVLVKWGLQIYTSKGTGSVAREMSLRGKRLAGQGRALEFRTALNPHKSQVWWCTTVTQHKDGDR